MLLERWRWAKLTVQGPAKTATSPISLSGPSWLIKSLFYTPKHHNGIPCGSAGEESTCNAGDLGSIPGLGRSPREGKGRPLQHSGLESSMG